PRVRARPGVRRDGFRRPEARPGDLGAWYERVEIAGHRAGFLQGEPAPEGGHDRTAALQDDPGPVVVGPRRLPDRVGEVRHVGDVPSPAAVHAVAADAVPVEEAHDDATLLLRAPQPVPGAADVAVDDVAGAHRMAHRVGVAPEMRQPLAAGA